jgi:hypothetical protein
MSELVAGNQALAVGSGGGSASKSTYPRSRNSEVNRQEVMPMSTLRQQLGEHGEIFIVKLCIRIDANLSLSGLKRGQRDGVDPCTFEG